MATFYNLTKRNVTLLLLLVAVKFGFSQTTISGGSVFGHWPLSGSPYIINGSIQIPNDSTLTIDPGVTVNFQGTYKFLINGRLLAIGTATDTIIFTAADTSTGWRGIRFVNTATTNDSSKIIYCKIQYGKAGIAPDNNGGVISLTNFSKIVISNCRIQNNCALGATEGGGAIFCYQSSPIINNNIISYNVTNPLATYQIKGGAICSIFGNPIISYNTVVNNTSYSSTGIAWGGGVYCFGDGTITNNIISNNTVFSSHVTGSGLGAGIFSRGNIIIMNNIISNNTALPSPVIPSAGGGIFASGNENIDNNNINSNTAESGGGVYFNGSPYIINNSITNNTANGVDGGGGIYCNSAVGGAVIKNNDISYNNVTFSVAYGGGGIFCSNGSDSIMNNTISFNTSSFAGGGIYVGGAGGETIINNTVSNNLASGASGGGGIYLGSSVPQLLINNVITNNSAIDSMGVGGGIYFSGVNSTTKITNNTIANNFASNGGAVYLEAISNPIFNNCIFYGNSTSTRGAQVFINDEPSDPNFYYCDIQGGSSAFGLNNNFYTGTYQNNIDTDPLFVSPSGGSGIAFDGLNADWSLQAGSPCIDAGNPTGTYALTDIAGNPRVAGAFIDMGAYESPSISINVNEINFASKTNLYPNPSSGSFKIKTTDGVLSKLEIVDLLGKVVYSNAFQQNNSNNEIELESPEKGVYFAKYTISSINQGSESVFTEKIVIQ